MYVCFLCAVLFLFLALRQFRKLHKLYKHCQVQFDSAIYKESESTRTQTFEEVL